MYEAAHSGTWLRGRLTEVSRLLINVSYVSNSLSSEFHAVQIFR